MKQKIGIIKFGGITFILSGLLLLAQNLFLLPTSSPPLTDTELIMWLVKWRFNISMADEVFMFAAIFLIPSIAALYLILVKVDKIKALFGCGLLAVVIPIYVFLDIILGRLVYPVYNIELSADIYRLVLSIYYGGMHAAAIILSIATILLCFVIRKSAIGKLAANFGLVVGVLALVGAFPWLIGDLLTFICQLSFSVWLIILGVRIWRGSGQSEE